MAQRYEELDSLRGLAALSVFFNHMYLMFNESMVSKILFEYGPLRAFIAGNEAVILFFVLSGFVLALPFYSNSQINLSSFAIKRICRIYIPYLIAISLAILFKELFYTGKIEGFSNWFNVNWSDPLNSKPILYHLFLVGTFTSNLNGVVWSLVHEIRISLVFPIIMFILVRMNLIKGIGLALGLSGVSIIYASMTNASFWGTEFYVTIHYIAIFVLGALMARYQKNIRNIFFRLNTVTKYVLFIFGLILYLYAHPSFILNLLFEDFNPFYRTVIDSWFASIGAGILILFATSSYKVSKILKNKVVNYIGKISFSLYLVHLLVLFSCIHFFNGILPIWLILLIVVIFTFILSSVMYKFVEKPSIKLGKLLIRNIGKNKQTEGEISIPSKI